MADGYTYKNEKVLIPEEDYEVKVDEMGVVILPSGKKKLAIRFRIRDDIEGQSYGNKCLFEDIWQEKESPEHFNRKRINQLLGTQEIEDGKTFEDIYKICEFMKGACLQVHVVIVFDEYRGEDVNRVSYYKSSNNKPQTLEGTVVDKKPLGVKVEDDDTIPF